jgi:hypothetical protein
MEVGHSLWLRLLAEGNTQAPLRHNMPPLALRSTCFPEVNRLSISQQVLPYPEALFIYNIHIHIIVYSGFPFARGCIFIIHFVPVAATVSA